MEKLLEPYGLDIASCEAVDGYISHNFRIKTKSGKSYLLKHHVDGDEFELIQAENDLMQFLAATMPFEVSRPAAEMKQYEDGSFSRLLEFIPGDFLKDVPHTPELLINFGRAIGHLHQSLESYKSSPIAAYRHSWDLSRALTNEDKIHHITDPVQRKWVNYFFDQFRYSAFPQLEQLPTQVLHNDLNDWNVLCDGKTITGIIDFGDMCVAPKVCDLAVAMTYMMLDKEDPVTIGQDMLKGYCEVIQPKKQEIELLKYLIPARLCASVCHSAKKKSEGGDTEYVLVSEKPAWTLVEKWLTINSIRFDEALLQVAGLSEVKKADNAVEIRKRNLSSALSLSYSTPIHMSSAAFQYMYDAQGNTYLDAYNNIPHVGHSHPNVSRAISSQIRKLNTNTRYLYDSINEYSEKLLSYFPSNLDKVFFVNSGSAASDLAIRLSTNYHQRDQLLILEHGYHGNTRSAINISHYKFDGKGGHGAIDQVTTLPLPKTYQSKYSTGEEYAREAIQIIDDLIAQDRKPAAFIAEPISGCGGQVPLADGYLQTLYPYLKKNGIICVSDEVQVGFGRMGSCFWGYELYDVAPDMVILGKPMGNGHPIGAIVTTSEIAEAFNNGMEFFSSFGGNPVSMEVGKSVLETIEEENLQQNALDVGQYFDGISRELAKEFPQIGDIRNQGLFLGMEMVYPETLAPATDYAGRLKNKIKENFILTSTDGPFDNVLKLKPPICFSRRDADQFFEVFESVLRSTEI